MMHHIDGEHMHRPGPNLRKGRPSQPCNDKIPTLIRVLKECKSSFQARPQASPDDWPETR